jgi:hypothetical protein
MQTLLFEKSLSRFETYYIKHNYLELNENLIPDNFPPRLIKLPSEAK